MRPPPRSAWSCVRAASLLRPATTISRTKTPIAITPNSVAIGHSLPKSMRSPDPELRDHLAEVVGELVAGAEDRDVVGNAGEQRAVIALAGQDGGRDLLRGGDRAHRAHQV